MILNILRKFEIPC